MSIYFNADEIFEMAEQIERNGAMFYRLAAEKAENLKVRQRLLDLAAMEDEHEKDFAAMRASLTKREREPTAFDPDGQGALYLRAMADGHVFDMKSDPATWMREERTTEEVLRTAIELEKDSIVFYLGMKDMVPEWLGRDRIDAIVKEEMHHIALLNKDLVAVLKQP